MNAVWVGRFLGEEALTGVASANNILFFLPTKPDEVAPSEAPARATAPVADPGARCEDEKPQSA